MKSANAGLISLLGSGQGFKVADLYTFTLANGTVLRLTSFDLDLTYGGNTWLSTGPILERTRVENVMGLDVSTLTITITPRPSDTVAGLGWLAAAQGGVLDGATVVLDRAAIQTLPTVVGTWNAFSGRLAGMKINRAKLVVSVNSDTELLNIKMPRNLYQPGCLHTLYDFDCGLSRATFAVSGTVTAATATTVSCGLSQAAGYFDLGYIQFTSGALSGTRRTVKSYTPGSFTVLSPMLPAPSAGDTFTAYPGCDKKQSTCSGKFSNLANFRGTPYVPVPETAR